MSKEEIENIPQPAFLGHIDSYPAEVQVKYKAAFALGRMASLFTDFRKYVMRYKVGSYSSHEILVMAYNNPTRFVEHVTTNMQKYKKIAGYKSTPFYLSEFDKVSSDLILFNEKMLSLELRAIAAIGFNQQNHYNYSRIKIINAKKEKKETNA